MQVFNFFKLYHMMPYIIIAADLVGRNWEGDLKNKRFKKWNFRSNTWYVQFFKKNQNLGSQS